MLALIATLLFFMGVMTFILIVMMMAARRERMRLIHEIQAQRVLTANLLVQADNFRQNLAQWFETTTGVAWTQVQESQVRERMFNVDEAIRESLRPPFSNTGTSDS